MRYSNASELMRFLTLLLQKSITVCEVVRFVKMRVFCVYDVSCAVDLQDALRYENGRNICGSSIIVEWAKGPRRAGVRYTAGSLWFTL